MTDDWKLPRPAVIRDIKPVEPDELTAAEEAALLAHPRLAMGLLVEFLTDSDMARGRWVAWQIHAGRLSEVC